MKDEIKNQIPVEVTLSEGRIFSGVCLKESAEVLVLVNLNGELNGYDGVSIFLTEDIESYRDIDVKGIIDLNKDKVNHYKNRLPLNKIEGIKSAVKNLISEPLMAIYTIDYTDSYFVGKVEKTNRSIFEFKTVDPEGNWVEQLEVAYDGVTYIGFDTEYERELVKIVTV